MDLHSAFRRGAETLVRGNHAYQAIHREHGISKVDWELLTQNEHWTPDQARSIRSILANCIEVCMTICGMPPVPLPAQYAAAVIAIVVSPANRMVAAMKCPDTFDALQASGLQGTVQIEKAPPEQMIALVTAYSGGFGGEGAMQRLDSEIVEIVKKEGKK